MANQSTPPTDPPRRELGAEAIAVKIRWFGVLLGVLYVNLNPSSGDRAILNTILALGAGFTVLDTWHSLRGRIFLGRFPLAVSMLEAVFIGLLCHFDSGLSSPFRFYYLLSLICCAIRYSAWVTYLTCALDCVSYAVLYESEPVGARDPALFGWMLVVLIWVTWAARALTGVLKRASDNLSRLNAQLRHNQSLLEERIEERSRQLGEARAMVMHQEKMAAFGLLAAGIAHEVGDPLTSISSLAQMLQLRDSDAYTREKLGLVGGQLQRIRTILHELVEFSRPASEARDTFRLDEVIREALAIARYYKGTKSPRIETAVPADLPVLEGIRDQLMQAFFNLIINAIDATHRKGRVEITAEPHPTGVLVRVRDDGGGISTDHLGRLFQPYFTTKSRGTGLGLFVTRRLVEAHGGRVDYEPEAGMTTFRVVLPAARTLQPAKESDDAGEIPAQRVGPSGR